MKLIDVDKLLDFYKKEKLFKGLYFTSMYNKGKYEGYEDSFRTIKEQPVVDAELVVYAHWIKHYFIDDYYYGYHCSNCGKGWIESQPDKHRYCSWCGAKMNGGIDNV